MNNLKGKCIRCGAAIKMKATYCRKCTNEFGLNTVTPKIQKIANWLTAILLVFAGIYFISLYVFN